MWRSIGCVLILLVLNKLTNHWAAIVKGKRGEKRVLQVLKSLPAQEYQVLYDVLLHNREQLTQIDVIVISVFGIFIVEVKHYKGKIYGKLYEKTWTQVLGKKKFTFMNPIHQNYAHVQAITDILGEEIPIFPLVVFTHPEVHIHQKKQKVVQVDQLLPTIEALSVHQVLSQEEVAAYKEAVVAASLVDNASRKKHLKQVSQNE